ncbi:MAG: hypothetical protein IJ366_02880 [Clostridia bacterium]|nr:hypothetical protein [Clostridia bacterium]
MERKKCSINGESDARKCGMFDAFYASGDSEYAGVNVLADGTLRIDFMARNISNQEINNFNNEPLKIYALHLESDCYAILLRGMVDMDVIVDPNLYPDNRIEKIQEKNRCLCFLVDTASNSICGIKTLKLGSKAISFISQNAKHMRDIGFSTRKCWTAYSMRILPYSSDELVKQAVYYGKNGGSVSTRNLITIEALNEQ